MSEIFTAEDNLALDLYETLMAIIENRIDNRQETICELVYIIAKSEVEEKLDVSEFFTHGLGYIDIVTFLLNNDDEIETFADVMRSHYIMYKEGEYKYILPNLDNLYTWNEIKLEPEVLITLPDEYLEYLEGKGIDTRSARYKIKTHQLKIKKGEKMKSGSVKNKCKNIIINPETGKMRKIIKIALVTTAAIGALYLGKKVINHYSDDIDNAYDDIMNNTNETVAM